MNIYDLFPSRYVAAVDLNGHDVTVIIDHVEIEEMGKPPKVELKPVVHFSNAKKGMVLNKTNAMTIGGLYGPETDGWTGKSITLFVDSVYAFGSQQKAIRVRPHIPRPKPSDPQPDDLIGAPPADDDPDLDYQEDSEAESSQRARNQATRHAEETFEPTTNGTDATGGLHAEVDKSFPPDDRDKARHWVIETYTTQNTPDDIRTSSADLTDAEAADVAAMLRNHRSRIQKAWKELES